MKTNNESKNHISQVCLEYALELASPQEVFFAQYQAALLSDIIAKHKLPSHARILDYGCGDGTLSYIMCHFLPGVTIHGVDNNPDVVEIAHGWYAPQLPQLRFSSPDDTHENTYDVIYVAQVLHHMPANEQKAFLLSLIKKLASGGVLIMLEFNPYSPRQAWRFYRDPLEKGNRMIHPSSITSIISHAGLSSVQYHCKKTNSLTLLSWFKEALLPCDIYSVTFKIR